MKRKKFDPEIAFPKWIDYFSPFSLSIRKREADTEIGGYIKENAPDQLGTVRTLLASALKKEQIAFTFKYGVL